MWAAPGAVNPLIPLRQSVQRKPKSARARAMTQELTRRTFVTAGTASAALALWPAAGCAAPRPKMISYRSPSCGCCGKWVDAARKAGFDVTVMPTDDMMAVKAKHGVPDELLSCHTTLVAGYVVEGHVPFDAVRRLL